jgi:Ricin-type beta-trefoil lectin domain
MPGARFARVATLLAAVMVSPFAVAMPAHAAADDDRAGPFTYKNMSSGKCLDVAGGSTAPRGNIQVWTCHRGPEQQWFRIIDGELRNRRSNMCLDGNVGLGEQLFQWPCNGGLPQRWNHERLGNGNYVFQSALHPGQCLDVDRGVGPRVILWTCHRGPQQQWS